MIMAMAVPDITTPLPGPKAAAIIARDKARVSTSYTRDYPFVMAKGEGAVVQDVDGNVFLDCAAGIAVTRVLMIGNSYTFYNGMPWLLQAFSDGDAKPFEVTVLAYPNLYFTDHRGADAEKYIREKKWDFVVLQDYSLGPLTAAESNCDP